MTVEQDVCIRALSITRKLARMMAALLLEIRHGRATPADMERACAQLEQITTDIDAIETLVLTRGADTSVTH